MKKLWLLAAMTLVLTDAYAEQIALENADFESGVQNYPDGFDASPDVPGWRDGDQITDSGTENSNAWWGSYEGTSAFMRMGDSAYLPSDYTIQLGDEFTIGFVAKSWDGSSQWTATLFYDDPVNEIGSYSANINGSWTAYSNETRIVATPESVGGTLGVLFKNTGSGFANLDNVTIDRQTPEGPVTIIAQPESQTVEELRPVTFEVAYYGTLPIYVQWYRDAVPIPGATNDSYTLESTALSDNGVLFHAFVENIYSTDYYFEESSNAVLTVTADTTAPVIDLAYSDFPEGVVVQFSEMVDESSAEDVANYAISHAGGSLSISNAQLLDGGTSVRLTTAGQTLGGEYTLHVSNVQDLASTPNLIVTDSQYAFVSSPYIVNDIGGATVGSSSVWLADGGDVTAAGSGLGGSSDQFSFGHKVYSGDFDIQVRIDSIEFYSQWAQAGLMARDGLDDDDLFASVFATPGPVGCQFMSRSSVGGSAVAEGSFPSVFPGMWLRLRRTGNLFEGYVGIDGQTWEPMGSSTIAMSNSVEVGYFVASGDSSTAITASFRDEMVGSGSIVSHIALPFEPLGPSSRRGAMVISEIMVDTPSEWGGTNSLEFVEIYNTGLITEDLTGHRFSGEIDYTFPDGTMLAPGEFIVVAKDPIAAQSFYGVTCLGPYDGKLSNSGGKLRFRNELDGILLEVEYDNKAPWPVAAFGTGHSLVLSHPSYGENDARAWSASDVIGGSPGTFDGYGAEPLRAVVINEYLAHTDLPQVDYVELFNTTESAIDLSGAWLSDDAGTNKFQIANGTTIPARGFLSFDQNELGFALSADGEQIFLVNSNQTRVIDAIVFRGQENGVSEGRYPDGAPGFQRLSSVTEGAANTAPRPSEVVINEIMYHPISDSNNDEYIELYNRTGSPVDLSGWRLQGGISYEFPANTEIPANGYIVVAENATNLMAKYPQLNSANTYGNYGGSLNNSTDTIRLSMQEDLVSTNASSLLVTNIFYIPIDEVTYVDGGRWGEWSDGGGSSLELIDPDADNRQPANWADSLETNKAPWTIIDVTNILENGQYYVDEGSASGEAEDCNRLDLFLQGAGEVLVDDVEFLNNGGGSLNLNGDFSTGSNQWGFYGVTRHSYVENGVGPDGSDALHLVCVARGDTGANKAYNLFSAVPTISGSDTGTIRAKVRWLKGAKQFYIRLRGNWMEVCQNLNVPDDCGTPGLANSQLVSNAGPAIFDVSHRPALPQPGDDVLVTARAVDPDGIGSLVLYYRVDPASTYSTAVMYDTGAGGDAIAGDGIYSASIPGQSSGILVAFHIQASDSADSSWFPASAPEQECLVRWGDPEFSGSVGAYHLWMTAANVSFWNSRERLANDNIDATFVYGHDRVVYNVGTMYSGSPFHSGSYNGADGSFACDYEINFKPGELFLGSEPFVLSADDAGGGFWFDPSAQVDITGTWIGRKLGQQYNYRRHVHMLFNGLERGSIYQDGQQPNGEMLDEYFPDDSQSELRKIEDWFEFDNNLGGQGNIFGRITRVNQSNGEIDPKWYRWNWRPRATDDHTNWFNFTNLVAAVNDSSSPDWESRVGAWMDVRNFLRPIATYHICGCWDTYAYARGKNAYAFKPDGEGWRLLLWDIELALGNGSNGSSDSIYSTVDSVLFNMITSIPSVHREYLMAFQEAVDGPLASGAAASILNERYANLLANGVEIGSPQFIINYINARRSYLQSVLPSVAFGVDGDSSFSVSSNSVVLTGTAPLTVAEIQVNGIAYPLEWTSTTAWRMTVPLSAGLNSLSVAGVDRFGNTVSGTSAMLSVTYMGADLDPEGVVVINEIHPSPEDRDLQFLELHNTSTTNVFDLTGWRINGLGYTFNEGALIGPGEYLVLVGDAFRFADRYNDVSVSDTYAGSLDPEGETLTLYRPGALPGEEIVVDRVRYEAGAPWVSSTGGKSLQLVDASRDNARVANWMSVDNRAPAAPIGLVGIGDTWKYYESGDPGAGWEEPDFDDSSWSSGAGLLYDGPEAEAMPAPVNSTLTLGKPTYYFRKSFNYSRSMSGISLNLSTVIDDGGIVYLNGIEILRLGVAGGAVSHSTPANRTIVNAQYENFSIPSSALVAGENTLAAEVHQIIVGSRDVAFGATLDVLDNGTVALTPGAENAVRESLPAFPDLWLNEVQADNTDGAMDNVGDHDPWVELYNAGTTAASLDGYYLTPNYGNPTNWAFPAGTTVPAGGTLVVWCDAEPGETVAGVPHTDFTLASSVGQVGLVRMVNSAPQVVDYLNYTNLPSNWSYGDVPAGQPFYRFNLFYATPGVTNNGAAAPITVSINEWMADNDGTLPDPADNDYEDWFEIYNPGTNTVDLGGYFLTDDLLDPYKYEVPNNGHYTIAPGGFLLVWADGEGGQNSTNQPDLHAEFSLSKGGEAIGVFASDGTLIDSVTFGALAADVSEGRYPDGATGIFAMASPTPRAANMVLIATPVMDGVLVSGSNISFSWPSSVGQPYRVYYKDDLSEASWHPLSGILYGTGGTLSYTNSASESPHRFFGIGFE